MALVHSLGEPGGLQPTKTRQNRTNMKVRVIAVSLLAAALSAVTASAHILVTVSCPTSGNSAAGIHVCATLSTDGSQQVCGDTDINGFVTLVVPFIAASPADTTYHVCVDTTTLPAGATLSKPCQDITFTGDAELPAQFDLGGPFCSGTPSACWETGGGQIDSDGDGDKDSPCEWSFGGVIYPGCSSTAAGGGNLNIKNHVTGAHFKGENFTVIDCRGGPDKSPKVSVNIIDFIGTGEVTTSAGTVNVTFVGTFRDSHDSGANADGLYLQVTGPSGTIADFAIGSPPSNGLDNLFLLSTGNVQIHQSGCGK